MEERLKLNKKKFPNVIAAYGEHAEEVAQEMAKYTKGPINNEKLMSILLILESDLKNEKEESNCCASIKF